MRAIKGRSTKGVIHVEDHLCSRLRDASEPARFRGYELGDRCAAHPRYERERKLSRERGLPRLPSPTVVQLGRHTANMLAVEAADPVADNKASASIHTDASLRRAREPEPFAPIRKAGLPILL